MDNPCQPGGTFDHRSDLSLMSADDKVSLSVSNLGAVVSLNRARGDRYSVFDLGAPLPTGSVRACLPGRSVGMEMFLQVLGQYASGLDEQ